MSFFGQYVNYLLSLASKKLMKIKQKSVRISVKGNETPWLHSTVCSKKTQRKTSELPDSTMTGRLAFQLEIFVCKLSLTAQFITLQPSNL